MPSAPAPSAATVATTADTPTESRRVQKSPAPSNAPQPDPKRAKTSGVMSGIGDSEKRNFARNHAQTLFNEMVRTTSHPANPPAIFDQMTGAQWCKRQPWERFAGWLTDVEHGYKFRDGVEADGKTPKFSMLMASTCVNYIQDLMHSVRIKFGTSGSPEEKLFLQCTVKVNYHHRLLLVCICVPTTCLLHVLLFHLLLGFLCLLSTCPTSDSSYSSSYSFSSFVTTTPFCDTSCVFTVQDSGPEWTWLRQLRKNVIYKLCKLHAEAGEVEDKAACPLYPQLHVKNMIRGLLRCTRAHVCARAPTQARAHARMCTRASARKRARARAHTHSHLGFSHSSVHACQHVCVSK